MKKNNFVKLISEEGKKLNPEAPLQEYPRPQLVRNSYLNLNGLWDYAIIKNSERFIGYQGKIVVPYSPESILSGVEKIVMPDDVLYYRRSFTLPENFNIGRVILHFGAVDYKAEVYLNGNKITTHQGGYLPFNIDITDNLSDKNVLSLIVTDPTDKGSGARGKQKIKHGGIFYTPSSGIWQTVWLESVPDKYIESIRILPEIDSNKAILRVFDNGAKKVSYKVLDNGKTIAEGEVINSYAEIKMSDYTLWTPKNPKLYDIVITADKDTVTSYFGMRKFSVGKDRDGYMRIMLNNKPYFHNGLLDQGYYSDGLYTEPSDKAILNDLTTVKAMGFNMLRKHIKIEPLRWYYHCDKLGILVWQDMVCGGGKFNTPLNGIKGFLQLKVNDTNYKKTYREDTAGRQEYYRDLKETVDLLYNCVSLCLWVPFNESWGQFDSLKVSEYLRSLDKSRPIDHASGWHDQGGGDFKSLHIYVKNIVAPEPENKRAFILSEFGGYGYPVKDHVYSPQKIFGYRNFTTPEDLEKAYFKLYEKSIIPLIKQGLSAAVYTQLTDVEEEINGLLTYDRKYVKINVEKVKSLNGKIKY